MLIISLLILLGCMALGLPIYLSLLLSGGYILTVAGVPSSYVIATLYDGVYKFTLLAVPFFLLAGAFVEKTSFAKALLHYLVKWTGGIRGGVPISAVAANELFGAISGSSSAATATIGRNFFSRSCQKPGGEICFRFIDFCRGISNHYAPEHYYDSLWCCSQYIGRQAFYHWDYSCYYDRTNPGSIYCMEV